MVVLVSGKRQAVPLDRVGDEAGRDVVRDRVERVPHGRHVVPTEVGHQPAERRVVVLVEQRADAMRVAEVTNQLLTPSRAPFVRQRRVA